MTLNHIYRLVWSDVLEAWIAVSEITRAHGKRHSKALRLALSLLLLPGYVLGQAVPTTVVPTGGGTSAYVYANGVPIVNIKATNGAGLSHNQFLTYNVDSKGLVLNNGNLSQVERQSQLAGRVLANPNLVQQASVILNEVVTTNRSQLAGFTEVVGGRADVVVANPNGITCSGCGFINTDRVTLSTGTPVFGGSGSLSGFNVDRGDVLIQGAGFNASAQQVLDLVARSIKVESPIVTSATGSLQLVAGTNAWSYATRNVTGSVAGSGVAPTFAIDSAALGGMYAGRIRLIATEAGVGVRMLGEAAASADDFSLTSAGQVVIQSKLSAGRDLMLASQATGADAIVATDSNLSAKRDIGITAASGGLTLAGGVLTAANNISYAVQTLTDAATATVLTDNNKRYAGADFTLAVTGAVSLNGVTLGAGGHQGGAIDNLAVGPAGATLYGDTVGLTAASDLQLETAAVRASGDLSLVSTSGSISTAYGADQEVRSTSGKLTVNAGANLNNAGLMIAEGGNADFTAGGLLSNSKLLLALGALKVTAASVANTAAGAISGLDSLAMTTTTGNILNQGLLYAGNQLTVTADTTGKTGLFTNKGEIRSGGDVVLTADTFVNNRLIEANQDITITTNTAFLNEVEGGVPARTTTEDIVNNGEYLPWVMEGGGCIACDHLSLRQDTVTLTEAWAGPAPTSARAPEIVAGDNLTINFGSGSAVNAGGLLSAGAALAINGSNGANFTNSHAGLYTRVYRRHWLEEYTQCFLGFDCSDSYTYEYATDEWEFNYHPTWNGIAGFVVLWEGYVGRSGDGSPALENLARQRAYRHLDTETMTYSGPRAYLRGATVTLNVGALVNDGGGVVRAPYTPDSAPVPNSLPTNPNGYFVPSKGSSAHYLIETNPLYAAGSSYGGSDYLLKGLGIDPDATLKRLGDANYEAYLIRRQLVSQTGSNLLNGYASEADQMKRLMEQSVGESKRIGLTFGASPTAGQLASLTQDIVWMVETQVAGQKVLAPVVYLSPDSRKAIAGGAVIAGQEVNLNVASLSNVGGTISGTRSLDITAKGDVTNVSGTLKGGDVSVKSTGGDIVNQRAEGHGSLSDYKAAGIEATGNLALEAKGDIITRGAEVKAGGDASLAAGRDVRFDTVVDTHSSYTTTAGSQGLLVDTGQTGTAVTTEKNVGSSLTTGGDLKIKSGGDTTLAGTKAVVGGSLGIDSGGDVSILSRQDKTTTFTETSKSGFGVGGGLWGTEKTTTEDVVGKNFGSSITVGGDADVKAGKDMTLQGSDLTIGGAGKIDAGSVKILEGKDERRTITKTETQTYLSSGSSTGSQAAAASSAASGRAAASADASASAGANESSELNISEKRTTTVEYSKTTGVGSKLTTGGDLSIKARETATVRGSSVEAGKDLAVDAKNIEILAGTNEEKTTTTTSASKIGIYTDSKADASAEAGASATGMSASARAAASAKAEAESTATIGTRQEDSTTQTTDVTHTSSSLKSGGDMSLKAREEARFIGAKVESGRDLTIEAKDITNLAAEDSKVTTSSSKTTTAGIYLSGEASAKAEAEAKGGAGLLGGSAKAEAEASAEASAGLRVAHEAKGSEQGSTSNVVSTFKAGRDITRQASGTITDQGTQLEAGRDIKQSATTVKEIVAEDKTWSKESSEQHDARVGVYAGASAKAGASSQAGALGTAAEVKAEAEASAGLKGKYTYEKSSSESASATAVTSRYKAGGSITSTSTDKTTLIGTQFEAGKDVTIEAKSLDYQAARDTTSSSSGKQSVEAEAKAKLVGTAGAELSGAYDQNTSSSSSSTARAGGINAGGNVTVRTRDDARFEGTDISAGEKAKVESTAGNVTFDAAKSTTSSQSQGFNVNANISLTKQPAKGGKAAEKEGEGALGGGYSSSSSSSTTSKGASIKGRDVDVSAARDVTMEGTQVKSAGDTSVKAGGEVKLLEAKDSSKSSSIGIKADAKASKESQSGSVNVKAANEDKQTGKATKIESGGDTTVKGKGVTSQEAEITSAGKTKVEVPVKNLQKTRVDKGMKIDVGADAVRKPKSASDAKEKSGGETKSAGSTSSDGKSFVKEVKTEAKAPVKTKKQPKAKKKLRRIVVKSPAAISGSAGPAISPSLPEH